MPFRPMPSDFRVSRLPCVDHLASTIATGQGSINCKCTSHGSELGWASKFSRVEGSAEVKALEGRGHTPHLAPLGSLFEIPVKNSLQNFNATKSSEMLWTCVG